MRVVTNPACGVGNANRLEQFDGAHPSVGPADDVMGGERLADLIARIEKTVQYLQTLKPEQIDGSEDKTIAFKMRGNDVSYKGLDFLVNSNLPNFYFHLTTSYNILRSNGVDIGKRDFMGPA